MAKCRGSYQPAIRRHPKTGAAKCPECARLFDIEELAGTFKVNVPAHSPEPRTNVDPLQWPKEE
jgi:hypothetical protein